MKNADKCSDGNSTFLWLSVHKDRFENGHQKLFGLLLQHLLLVHLVFFCFYMFWGVLVLRTTLQQSHLHLFSFCYQKQDELCFLQTTVDILRLWQQKKKNLNYRKSTFGRSS